VHELVVVSDLHVGRGRDPETGRYKRLEAFFYDNDFYRFCSWLCEDALERGITFKLILNGDTFDLLRIDSGEPNPTSLAGIPLTPDAASNSVREMLEGHVTFVEGLARVLDCGHSIVFIAGNHDIEIQWQAVQDTIRNVITSYVKTDIEPNIEFAPWFYHEPNRLWVEHGCQYDEDNAFEYFLRTRTELMSDEFHKSEVGLPMGSLFQRYIYNNLGNITFIVPGRGAMGRYFRWLLFNKPKLVVRTFAGRLPLFLKMVWKSSRARLHKDSLIRLHESSFDALAITSGLNGKLYEVAKMSRSSRSDSVIGKMALGFLKGAGIMLLITMVILALWFASVYGLTTLATSVGLRAILFIVSNFGFVMLLFIAVLFIILRTAKEPESSPMRTTARRIGRVLDIPMVVFGHSHDEVVWSLSRGKGKKTKYFNTGSWASVFTRDQLVPRERVQYTFLHIVEDNGTLLQWSPGRDKPMPVILLDDGHPSDEPTRPTDAVAS